MKNIIIVAACLWGVTFINTFAGAQVQQKFAIKGKIDNQAIPMQVALHYQRSKGDVVNDTAILNNGAFYFKGTIEHPVYATLRLINSQTKKTEKMPDMQSFYLVAGLNLVEGTTVKDAVINNQVQKDYQALLKAEEPLTIPWLAIQRKLFQTSNKDSVAILNERKKMMEEQWKQFDIDFIKAHPDSWVSFDMVSNQAVIIDDPVSFSKMFNALAPKFQNSPEGKHMAQDLAMVKRLAIGQQAVAFTQTDPDGKPVSLSSLKGKFVLIDFWASWCGPCRAEYPFLHRAYAEFKDKNFEIISVSIDDKRNLWTNAIKENQFDWLQVSDLKGRNNAVARAYGISAIPRNFLIAPNGVIVAKDLRGEALMNKLKEIIKTYN